MVTSVLGSVAGGHAALGLDLKYPELALHHENSSGRNKKGFHQHSGITKCQVLPGEMSRLSGLPQEESVSAWANGVFHHQK